MQIGRRLLSEGLFNFSRSRIFTSHSYAAFQLTVFQSTARVDCHNRASSNRDTPWWSKPLKRRPFRPRSGPVRFIHGNGTMKLDSPEFHACFTPQLIKLADMFTRHGYELRIAGGAVRDMLMGLTPHDIDFATNATPEQMKAMFAEENVKTFNEKGEKHGTVSARIDGKENFEITTLRIDVTTDGRHAEVQFTQDWVVDANRRDLTVNSMFLGLDGTLYDYFNGHEDLKKGVCSFVGDPDARIREDYLRILRYFRFFGRICQDPHAHKEEVLIAIKNNLDGLKNISGERVWNEMSKILKGAHSKELMLKMIDVGIAPYIGLPEKEKLNITEFERLSLLSSKDIEPIVKIAAFLHTDNELLAFHKRCKLSANERDLGLFIIKRRYDVSTDPHPLRLYQNLLLFTKMRATLMREFIHQLLKYQNKASLIHHFQEWRLPPFPLNGNILRAYGVSVHGKELGTLIDALKMYWSEQDFNPTREDLLRHLPMCMAELGMKPVVPKFTYTTTPKEERRPGEYYHDN